jgi:hypothetical protein
MGVSLRLTRSLRNRRESEEETLEYCNVLSAKDLKRGSGGLKSGSKSGLERKAEKGLRHKCGQICGLRYEGIITTAVRKELQITCKLRR